MIKQIANFLTGKTSAAVADDAANTDVYAGDTHSPSSRSLVDDDTPPETPGAARHGMNLAEAGGGVTGSGETQETFPAKLGDAIRLLQKRRDEHEKMPGHSRAQNIARRQFYETTLAPLARHILQLQHGATAPTITANDFAALKAAKRSGHEPRAERLEKLRALVALGIAKIALTLPTQPDEPRALVARDSVIQDSLLCAAFGFVQFEVACGENYSHLFPENRADEIRHALRSATSAEERTALSQELAQVTRPHARELATNAKAEVIRKLALVEPFLHGLLTRAIRIVNDHKADAIKSEATFFAAHLLKREPTSVSRQFDGTIRELEGLQKVTQDPGRHASVPRVNPVLVWFGIKDSLEALTAKA